MNGDSRLLGEGAIIQSLPRLLRQHGVKAPLPSERDLYGASLEEFNTFISKHEAALSQLFQKFKISWNEVYLNSDIGKERILVAKKIGINVNDSVLDVGCGRGFFTIAAAFRGKSVIGLDLMNGLDRKGWWQRFNLTMRELSLHTKVTGVKATAAMMPFRNEAFSLVASIHAIRNFPDVKTIQTAFKEMKRVTQKGGRVILVENLPVAKNRAQEAHLKMFNCKVKYTRGEMPYRTERQLTSLFEKAGLRRPHTEIFDFNLKAVPPLFFLNTLTLPKKQALEARREYNGAVSAVRKWGEASPPSMFAEAIVE
jgi:ubiquinone/menaquinone biosynthesis C-methylase UbiE